MIPKLRKPGSTVRARLIECVYTCDHESGPLRTNCSERDCPVCPYHVPTRLGTALVECDEEFFWAPVKLPGSVTGTGRTPTILLYDCEYDLALNDQCYIIDFRFVSSSSRGDPAEDAYCVKRLRQQFAVPYVSQTEFLRHLGILKFKPSRRALNTDWEGL